MTIIGRYVFVFDKEHFCTGILELIYFAVKRVSFKIERNGCRADHGASKLEDEDFRSVMHEDRESIAPFDAQGGKPRCSPTHKHVELSVRNSVCFVGVDVDGNDCDLLREFPRVTGE